MGYYCKAFLQSLLKALNFILLLCGLLMLLYSWWLYKEWVNEDFPTLAPEPSPGYSWKFSGGNSSENASAGIFSSGSFAVQNIFDRFSWPDSLKDLPWFIYATFGAGAFIVLVTLTGACAAETHSACCLSCYQFGLLLILTIQAAFAALIFFDKDWERELPDDPTGQARKAKDFILDNLEICKWGGLAVLLIELFSLILALVLRVMAVNSECDDECDVSAPNWQRASKEPLLPQHYVNPGSSSQPQQLSMQSPPVPQLRTQTSDAWRTRMLEKYGLDTSDFAYASERQARDAELRQAGLVQKRRGDSCSLL